MRLLQLAYLLPAITAAVAGDAPSTDGIAAFVKRRLPSHADSFEFSVTEASHAATAANDSYTVSSAKDGKIKVEGSSLSAVMQG